jgi:hypothetical protein
LPGWALHWTPVLRRSLWGAYFHDPQARARSKVWARRYCRTILMISCVWGLAPLLFLPRDNAAMSALLIVVMMATCATGALSVSRAAAGLWSGSSCR